MLNAALVELFQFDATSFLDSTHEPSSAIEPLLPLFAHIWSPIIQTFRCLSLHKSHLWPQTFVPLIQSPFRCFLILNECSSRGPLGHALYSDANSNNIFSYFLSAEMRPQMDEVRNS